MVHLLALYGCSFTLTTAKLQASATALSKHVTPPGDKERQRKPPETKRTPSGTVETTKFSGAAGCPRLCTTEDTPALQVGAAVDLVSVGIEMGGETLPTVTLQMDMSAALLPTAAS